MWTYGFYKCFYRWFLQIFKVKYVLTEDRNFNTFLKENYAIALDSCCFTKKKNLNMEFDMILIVLKGFACIRHT